MVKFRKLKELNVISSILVVAKYSFCFIFFIYQGEAISLSLDKVTVFQKLLYALLILISTKIIVMFSDIFNKYISERYKNYELYIQWSALFPKKIFRDVQNSHNKINVLFFEYLPRLFELENSIFTNFVTIFYVLILATIAFIYTKFYIGIFALLLIFLFNYFTKNLFVNKIDEYQKIVNNFKIKLLAWVNDYFDSYREVSKNWCNIGEWGEISYNDFYYAKKKQINSYLFKDILNQVSVEIPFLINTSIVILAIYNDYISLVQMFVWVGFSQFMINASNSALGNRMDIKHRNSLLQKTNEILKLFAYNSDVAIINRKIGSHYAEITMRDGTINTLTLNPGIYHIKGGNGSGKSSLFNYILGYERLFDFDSFSKVSQLAASLSDSDIRVVERDVVIFDCFDKFNEQVCGPFTNGKTLWNEKVRYSLYKLLSNNLACKWFKIFSTLESEFIKRNNNSFSSGEKVVLSFMRFLFSWNAHVKLLIVDECDSFLDDENKELFLQSLMSISLSMAVYIGSHDPIVEKVIKQDH